MDIVRSLLVNLANLFAMTALYSMLVRPSTLPVWLRKVLTGIAFGIIAIAGMMIPFTFQPGIIFDGRSVVISLSGMFGGALTGTIAALIAAAYRLALGGTGALTGVAVIFSSLALGLAHRYLVRREIGTLPWYHFYGLGVVVHAVMLLWMLTLPKPTAYEVLRVISLPVMLFFPLGNLAFGLLLVEQYRRIKTRFDLALSEERYRTLIDAADDLIFTIDRQGRYTSINRKGAERFFSSPDDFIGKTPDDFYPPEEAAFYHEQHRRVLEEGETVTFERKLNNEISQDWFSITLSPIFAPDGEIIGAVGISRNITPLKQLQEHLQDREKRLEKAQRAARMGFLDWNLRTNQIYLSNMVCDLYGIEGKEVWTAPELVSTVVHPDDMDFVQRELDLAVRGEKPFNIDHRILRPDGEVLWVNARAELTYDQNGEPLYLLGTVLDITERKLAEQALRESEQRYRNILEVAPVGFAIHQDGKVVFANPAGLQLIGAASEDEIKGKDITEIIHPDNLETSLKRIRRMMAGETGLYPVEDRYIRLDGKAIDVEVIATALEYMGRPAVQVIVTDITERKRNETRIRQQTQRLSLLHAIDQAILAEGTPLELFKTTAEQLMTIISCQQMAFAEIDDKRSVFRTRAYYDADGFTETRGEEVDFSQWPLLERLRPGEPVILTELAKHPEHNLLTSQITASNIQSLVVIPICDEDKPIAIISLAFNTSKEPSQFELDLLRDVTTAVSIGVTQARLRQEYLRYAEHLEALVEQRTEELRQAQEQLIRQERLAALGQLSGGVGHELRNPLGVINNAVYYLRTTNPDAQPSLYEYLDIIQNEVHTATRIIENLLTFGREIKTDRRSIPVQNIVDLALRDSFVPKTIQTVVNLPPDLPNVFVDSLHVEQALKNLISNATQAMPQGGTLTISAEQDGDFILLKVSDTGVGIPPENMPRLFEPLFTTKARGMGLGLALSRKLIRANEGEILVESEVGKGSTFTLRLPTHRMSSQNGYHIEKFENDITPDA